MDLKSLARAVDEAYENSPDSFLSNIPSLEKAELDNAFSMVAQRAAGDFQAIDQLLLEKLLLSGADIDGVPARFPALYFALVEGDLTLADFLLSNGGSPNARSWLGITTLAMLIHDYAPATAVLWLIDAGADVDGLDSSYTPIIAALGRDFTQLPVILENGADPNKRLSASGGSGYSAMGAALFRGVAALQLMIAAGGDPMNWAGKGYSLLRYAASHGLREQYDYLVAIGYRDDCIGRDPWLAASAGDEEAVRRILETFEEPEPRDTNGRTPVVMAALSRRATVVADLLRRGADPDQYVRWTWRNDPAAVDPWYPDDTSEGEPDYRDGRTLLTLTVSQGDLLTTAVLVDGGADVDQLDEHDETPLIVAADGLACASKAEILELLLMRGADPNHRGGSRARSAIHGAVDDAEKYSLLQKLLQFGAQIDIRDGDGMTPLMCAAYYGNPAAVEILLHRGADSKLRDDDDMTAMDLAEDELASLRDRDTTGTSAEIFGLERCLRLLKQSR